MNNSNPQKNKSYGDIIVGLDIGTTKTVMIAAKKDQHGKIEVLGYGYAKSKGMKKAKVINSAEITESIIEAYEKCLASNKNLKINEVIVGISGRYISCKKKIGYAYRKNNNEEITREEIEKLKNRQIDNYIKQGKQIISIIPEYYFLDNKTKVQKSNIVGCSAKKIEGHFNVISGGMVEIKKIINSVKRAGLKIKAICPQPLASALAILSTEIKQDVSMVIDIGGGTTDVAVFQEGALTNTFIVEFGGNFITEEIHESLVIRKQEQSETLKKIYGTCIPDNLKSKNLSVAIDNEGKGTDIQKIALVELSYIIHDCVQKIIDQIKSNLISQGVEIKKLKGDIFITGGGALLHDICELMTYEFGLETIEWISETCLINTDSFDEETTKILMHPLNITCYGLILHGFDIDKTDDLPEN